MEKIMNKLNKENVMEGSYAAKRTDYVLDKARYVCMLSVFLIVLFGSPLLCGCGADTAEDEIQMKLSGTDAPSIKVVDMSESQIVSMTDVPKNTSDSSQNTTDMSENKSINMTDVSENELPNDTEAQSMYIYICGAVANPGVYELAAGSRLYEAVELAGGLTEEADSTCLNLARQIADGEQVVIWTQEETAALEKEGKYPPGQSSVSAAGSMADVSNIGSHSGSVQGLELVNINTATLTELTTVSGIGESRAEAIIAYREANGGFRCIEDIKKVDGIKEGLFSKIKDKITV